MKGRAPTADEKEFMNKIARLGCIACRKMGFFNDYVSLHHIEGRIKPGCHYKVLPLCERHHQLADTNKPPLWHTLHHNKRAFEREYGTEMELYHECLELIGADSEQI